MQKSNVLLILLCTLNLFSFYTLGVLNKHWHHFHYPKKPTIHPSRFHKDWCKNLPNPILKECRCFEEEEMHCENKKYCAKCPWLEMPVCKNLTTNTMETVICPQQFSFSK